MIEITNTSVMNFENAIRGARNPMNSWARMDSTYDENGNFIMGENDLGLAQRLARAGSDHRKYLRQILVSADIKAPLYWIAEHDTYKVATVRNSCSFMHKGMAKPFDINDFSVQDERVYYLLNPIEPKKYELIYPYETEDYKTYTLDNGREYKIFKNGKVISCEFDCDDITGRKRHFAEREVSPSRTNSGYYEVHLGGRNGERWALHRLVATVWLEGANHNLTVNHINGNKGDNSADNLEWCTLSHNIKNGFADGLYEPNKLHLAYNSWKNSHIIVSPEIKLNIKRDHKAGCSRKELCEKYNIPQKSIDNILYIKPCENEDLFALAYTWEKLIEQLNILREEYLETKDNEVFQVIRQLLPSGYNMLYTWTGNYETLINIYHSRKNHRLKEWHTVCDWIASLPYAKELIIDIKEKDNA